MTTSNSTPFPRESGSADAGGESTPFPGQASPRGAVKAEPLDEPSSPSIFREAAQPVVNKLQKSGLLTVGDMVGSIPASIAGVISDLSIRLDANPQTHMENSKEANAAYGKTMDAFGSPLHKLLVWAGMGDDGSTEAPIDRLMTNVDNLVSQGGDAVNEKTKGAINSDDVQSVYHAAMALAGGKGLKAGLTKLAARSPKALLDAAGRTPAAEESALRERVQQSEDPQAAAKAAGEREATATKAVVAKTKLADLKTLVLDPVSGELSESTPLPGKALPKPSSIESALGKVSTGRRFDMTAEERIAYKDFEEQPPVGLVDPRGRPLRLGGSGRHPQSGSIDPDLLGVGLIMKGVKWLSVQDLSALKPSTSLKDILDRSRYTLKTLDRLPQDKAEFSKAHIEQELNRTDVTAPEKATMLAALAEAPAGDKVSAKDLMFGVKKAMGDFELTAEKTEEFADYGLDSLGRHSEGSRDPDEWAPQNETADEEQLRLQGIAAREEVPTATTLYRLPEHMELSDNNHFSDKRLFGWTRSFYEGGVRHVVEIQSDLAQRVGKVLGEEERNNLKRNLVETQEAAARIDAEPYTAKSLKELKTLRVLEKELETKLKDSVGLDRVAPILKNWPKRLIREELAEAAEGSDGGLPPDTENVKIPPEVRSARTIPPAKSVRFATADTVAKVEGWPELAKRDAINRSQGYTEELSAEHHLEQGSRFGPQHQSIYDRYRRDIEKFLRQLGGKDYTDEHGHTWIEVPTPRRNGRLGGPRQMHGYVKPEMLARLAVVGLGTWAGAYFSDDDKWQHMIAGAFGAALISKAKPIQFAKAVGRALGKEAPRMSIADPARDWDSYKRLWALDTNLLLKKMETILPKEADRIAVLHAREAGPAAVAKLSPKQREFARHLDEAFNDRLWEGVDNDVLHSAADNYVTHIWDWSGNNKNAVERFLASYGTGMSQSTPFAKERSIPTYAAGKAVGLKPVSEDPLYILGAYSNSLINAIATKNLIGALKTQDVLNPVGKPMKLLLPAETAPRSYVSINHQSLRGFKVHPDIEGQMKLLFDTAPAGDWMKAAIAVSDTAKHMGISMSLFHGKSLGEAAIRASNNPLRTLVKLPGIVWGSDDMLRELSHGSSSPLVKDAITDGVMFSVKGVGSEDGGAGFYPAMAGASKFLDSVLPHSGAPIRGFAALNKKLDTVLWERLHPALKLYIYAEKRNQILSNSIKAAKGGGQPSMTKAQAGRIAASFANDLEGGLNYQRIAMEAQTQFGRMIAEKSFTPAARRGMQVAFFAPDWNISAVRMVAQAFRPEGSAGGILQPKTLADLHRQLVLRSALYYFIGFNALNYALSGHYIWQNKDWTKIDMDPKGERHLQIDKGMMEVPNMVRQPEQEFLNKLGFIPSEVGNQLAGTEYMAPRVDKRTGQPVMGPPMESSRVGHVASRLLPFATKQSPTTGPVEEAATRLGLVQITGSTPETRAAKKLVEKRRKQRLRDDRAKEGK